MLCRSGLTLCAAALLLGVGCVVPSAGLETADLRAEIVATSDGRRDIWGRDRIDVSATLWADDWNAAGLSDGDQLVASVAGGEAEEMSSASLDASYDARLRTREDRPTVQINFDRSWDISAPESVGTFPPPFEIDRPRRADRLEPLTLTWQGRSEGDPMRLRLEGVCFEPYDAEILVDVGSFTLEPGALRFFDGGACEARVWLTRIAEGEPDPAFHSDSAFELHEIREMRFRLR